MRTAGFWPPLIETKPYAGQLRELGREARVDHVLNLREGHGVRGNGQREDRRVGRIGLGVDRRDRQIGRQKCLAAVDRRLHFFLADVERQRKAELEHDDRNSAGAGRSHLAQALHLAELAFQGRSDGGRYDIRAGAGIEGDHLDRRVVNLRQGRNGQLEISDQPSQENCGHQQRGSNRPQNEWPRWTHGAASVVSEDVAGIVTLEMEMVDPLTSF